MRKARPESLRPGRFLHSGSEASKVSASCTTTSFAKNDLRWRCRDRRHPTTKVVKIKNKTTIQQELHPAHSEGGNRVPGPDFEAHRCERLPQSAEATHPSRIGRISSHVSSLVLVHSALSIVRYFGRYSYFFPWHTGMLKRRCPMNRYTRRSQARKRRSRKAPHSNRTGRRS